MTVTLLVCSTCRAGEAVAEGDLPPGARLAGALTAAGAPGIAVRSVACLSACSQGCAVALASRGRWSYVYGRMTEADVPDILAGATAYAAAPDGIVTWHDRPEIFRKRALARIPPIGDPQ